MRHHLYDVDPDAYAIRGKRVGETPTLNEVAPVQIVQPQLLLEWVQQHTLSSQTQGYQIWMWTDTNLDGIVQPPNGGDTYTWQAGA